MTFKEISLYPLLTEFSLDRWEYLQALDKKYRPLINSPTLDGFANETADVLIVDYVLGYLLDQKRIAKETYDRLMKGRKFVYISHLPKDRGSDEELFMQYVTEVQPDDFLGYLARKKFLKESASESADALDKLSIEIITDFRQWIAKKVRRGTKTLNIPELLAGDTQKITAILQFPHDVNVGNHDLRFIATWTYMDDLKQTVIELPVVINDRWHWLRVALIWLAGAVGIALVRVLVKWLFDISVAEWLKQLYERRVKKRRWLVSKLISATCEISPAERDANVSGRLALEADISVQNRQTKPTSIRCISCRAKAGRIIEDFGSVELRPEGMTQGNAEAPVAASSAVRISIHSEKEHGAQFQEALQGLRSVKIAIVLEETFGAIATIKSKVLWRNPRELIKEAAAPFVENA